MHIFKKPKNILRTGFTIIEILMVFAIISILVSMAYSKLSIIRSKEDLQATNRVVTKSEISHGVLQYFQKNGKIPRGIPIGANNKKPICAYGVTDNPACVNLDSLVEGNFLTALKRDDSKLNTDDELLGYEIYWDATSNDISVLGITDTVAVAESDAPTVTTTVPLDNQTGVSPSAKILTMTFNEPVWSQLTGDNDIRIFRYATEVLVETIDAGNSAKVTGSSTNQIRIILQNDFDELTQYYVLIGTNAFKDANGTPYGGIASKITWDFTTGIDSCFIAGTPILLSDGTYKHIEDIELGDTVIGFDPSTLELVPQAVTKVWNKRISTDLYQVVTDSETLFVTGAHPFLTAPNVYTKVADLQVGDSVYRITNADIAPSRIVSIEPLLQSTAVYNIATDMHENYIAHNTLVHNKSELPSSASTSSATTPSSSSESSISSSETTPSSSSESSISSSETTPSSSSESSISSSETTPSSSSESSISSSETTPSSSSAISSLTSSATTPPASSVVSSATSSATTPASSAASLGLSSASTVSCTEGQYVCPTDDSVYGSPAACDAACVPFCLTCDTHSGDLGL